MILTDLIHIWISDNFSINVEIGSGLIIIFIILLTIMAVRFLKERKLFFRETELNIALGGIGSVKIKPSHEVAQIAHKAWSELVTRKAAIEFDPKNDLIIEIYNSWYQLFAEIRKLIKEIPACYLKNNNTRKLSQLLVDSLNKGLRLHLTVWQAKFRRWYSMELEKEKNKSKTPQEIQRTYPQYKEMIKDIVSINRQLIEYATEIKKLFS